MSLTDMVIMPGADYQAACDAIREKTEGVGYIRSGDMAELIRGIETGTELPELTNPAGAEDIASGKEVVDGEGNRLTGTLRDAGNLSMQATTIVPAMWAEGGNPTMVDTLLRCTFDMENAIFRKGETAIEMRAGYGVFGDATAEDVAAGKTFTSTAGLKVTGTAAGGLAVEASIKMRGSSVVVDSARTMAGTAIASMVQINGTSSSSLFLRYSYLIAHTDTGCVCGVYSAADDMVYFAPLYGSVTFPGSGDRLPIIMVKSL
jgi:hypothetical protein